MATNYSRMTKAELIAALEGTGDEAPPKRSDTPYVEWAQERIANPKTTKGAVPNVIVASAQGNDLPGGLHGPVTVRVGVADKRDRAEVAKVLLAIAKSLT